MGVVVQLERAWSTWRGHRQHVGTDGRSIQRLSQTAGISKYRAGTGTHYFTVRWATSFATTSVASPWVGRCPGRIAGTHHPSKCLEGGDLTANKSVLGKEEGLAALKSLAMRQRAWLPSELKRTGCGGWGPRAS